MIIKVSQPYLDTSIRLIMKTFMKSFSVFLSENENFPSIEELIHKKEEDTSLEEKEAILQVIKEAFYNYVDSYCEAVTGLNIDDDQKLKLKEIFSVQIVTEIKDSPEQGKSWYWIASSDYCINQ